MNENTTAKAQVIEPGHHWRDGWFFFRLPTGAVRIRKHLTADPDSEIVEEMEIPGEQWCSIVIATARDGETGVNYGLANALHWGTCRADRV